MGLVRALLGFINNPAREARQLNRDAASIIEDARTAYRIEKTREIARCTRTEIEAVEAALEIDPGRRAMLMAELKRRHREARRRYEPVALSSYTLAIIHFRAQAAGDAALPAREAIAGFTAEYVDDADHPDPDAVPD